MKDARIKFRVIVPVLFAFATLAAVSQPAGAASYTLSFLHPPTDTKEGLTISREQFNPDGGAIQVQLSSSSGAVNNKTISMAIASPPSSAFTSGSTTTATTDGAGIASFSNLVIDTPGHYTLKAFNTKLGVSAFANLTIWQNACPFDQSGGCPATGSGNLSVGYTASSNATAGKLIVNTGVDPLSATDGYCHAPAVTTAEATSDFNGTSRTIVLTFPKSRCGGAGQYQVLLGKTEVFKTLGGGPATWNDADNLYEGDAPPCNATYQIDGAAYMITPGVDPCLQSSVSRKSPVASQIETLIVPGTDIRCK